MCNISQIYNPEYISKYLETHKFLIANVCPGYNKESFDMFLSLYNKYSNDFLCDWFPTLWAIVFYKDKTEERNFLEMVNAQIGTDTNINTYTPLSKIEIQDNQAIIIYNTAYRDYVTFDEEKNVG